jgi:hypothetical protein
MNVQKSSSIVRHNAWASRAARRVEIEVALPGLPVLRQLTPAARDRVAVVAEVPVKRCEQSGAGASRQYRHVA